VRMSRDARRFLMMKTDRPDKPASLVVVQNWLAELTRTVPTNRSCSTRALIDPGGERPRSFASAPAAETD
jgi:hypothetical protein